MGLTITLEPRKLTKIREIDPRVQSYNVEMTELTGGTFWKPYTPEQVAGTEEFPVADNMQEMMKIMQSMQEKLPEINLYDEKIRTLAKAFGPVIIRISGSWATRTYYDLDNHTNGVVPEGFEFVLTKEQWQGALDFVKAVNGQILVSVANCTGVHENGIGAWTPDQAKVLWDYTKAQGMSIDYAEFMNEPNMLQGMMLPEGYSVEDFGRDHDLFAAWLKENHPETKLVGPCSADSPRGAVAGGFGALLLHTDDLLGACKIMPDIFSYHSYNGISERGQMFGQHYSPDVITTSEYLNVTMEALEYHRTIRDKFTPGAPMWVTESADAACGGNTWAPTFVESLRYVNELALFNQRTDGIIFHNTLASSAYGLLEAETHNPRPQYWAALLYSKLAGTTVYDTHEPLEEGAHVFAHNRKDGKAGVCYIVINNSRTDVTTVKVPACEKYVLTSDALRSLDIQLNGTVLKMVDDVTLPDLKGEKTEAGKIELPPVSVTFLITEDI